MKHNNGLNCCIRSHQFVNAIFHVWYIDLDFMYNIMCNSSLSSFYNCCNSLDFLTLIKRLGSSYAVDDVSKKFL